MQTSLRIALSAICILAASAASHGQAKIPWKIHDLNRPVPRVIDPGTSSTQDSAGHRPSDAVVLFDGKDLSKWVHKDGSAAKWKVENGFAEVGAGTGDIFTKDAFGDCQLHVEFAEPTPASGLARRRGWGCRWSRGWLHCTAAGFFV